MNLKKKMKSVEFRRKEKRSVEVCMGNADDEGDGREKGGQAFSRHREKKTYRGRGFGRRWGGAKGRGRLGQQGWAQGEEGQLGIRTTEKTKVHGEARESGCNRAPWRILDRRGPGAVAEGTHPLTVRSGTASKFIRTSGKAKSLRDVTTKKAAVLWGKKAAPRNGVGGRTEEIHKGREKLSGLQRGPHPRRKEKHHSHDREQAEKLHKRDMTQQKKVNRRNSTRDLEEVKNPSVREPHISLCNNNIF